MKFMAPCRLLNPSMVLGLDAAPDLFDDPLRSAIGPRKVRALKVGNGQGEGPCHDIHPRMSGVLLRKRCHLGRRLPQRLFRAGLMQQYRSRVGYNDFHPWRCLAKHSPGLPGPAGRGRAARTRVRICQTQFCILICPHTVSTASRMEISPSATMPLSPRSGVTPLSVSLSSGSHLLAMKQPRRLSGPPRHLDRGWAVISSGVGRRRRPQAALPRPIGQNRRPQSVGTCLPCVW